MLTVTVCFPTLKATAATKLGIRASKRNLAATQRATDEIVQLNQRVSDLQRVSAECVAAQTKAAADIATLCDEAQKAKLHALRTQLSELQQEAARKQVLVEERERWAEEAVEAERRLFQDALLRVQGAHMVGQREVLQD